MSQSRESSSQLKDFGSMFLSVKRSIERNHKTRHLVAGRIGQRRGSPEARRARVELVTSA
jgi:hypothetical protein